MTAYVNYPLTASDDDEFFDAPAGSSLLNPNGDVAYTKVDNEFGWEATGGLPVQAGVVWGSLFKDGNPFGDYDIDKGWTLRVTLAWHGHYGMSANTDAAIAEADARLAAMMAGAA